MNVFKSNVTVSGSAVKLFVGVNEIGSRYGNYGSGFTNLGATEVETLADLLVKEAKKMREIEKVVDP